MNKTELVHYKPLNHFYVNINDKDSIGENPLFGIYEYCDGYFRVNGVLGFGGRRFKGWLSSKRVYKILKEIGIEFNPRELTTTLKK